jgi:hypothetical protein
MIPMTFLRTTPVFKLEICTTGDTCTAASDAGWKSLDDLP